MWKPQEGLQSGFVPLDDRFIENLAIELKLKKPGILKQSLATAAWFVIEHTPPLISWIRALGEHTEEIT